MTSPDTSASGVVAVCPLAALAADGDRWVHDGVVVARVGNQVLAFEDRCPHAGANLADAEIRRGVLRCPQHRARFRLADGAVLAGPPRRPLVCYDVEPAGASLLVRTRPAQPAVAPSGWRRLLRVLKGLGARRT